MKFQKVPRLCAAKRSMNGGNFEIFYSLFGFVYPEEYEPVNIYYGWQANILYLNIKPGFGVV